jgi:uncharacterized protein YejL (UPF0352 family)
MLVPFDTLKLATRLEAAGLPWAQAAAITKALAEAMVEGLAKDVIAMRLEAAGIPRAQAEAIAEAIIEGLRKR